MKNLSVNNELLEENSERKIALTGKPSIDKPWLKYYVGQGFTREEIEHPDIPKKSIYQLAKEMNKHNGKMKYGLRKTYFRTKERVHRELTLLYACMNLKKFALHHYA